MTALSSSPSSLAPASSTADGGFSTLPHPMLLAMEPTMATGAPSLVDELAVWLGRNGDMIVKGSQTLDLAADYVLPTALAIKIAPYLVAAPGHLILDAIGQAPGSAPRTDPGPPLAHQAAALAGVAASRVDALPDKARQSFVRAALQVAWMLNQPRLAQALPHAKAQALLQASLGQLEQASGIARSGAKSAPDRSLARTFPSDRQQIASFIHGLSWLPQGSAAQAHFAKAIGEWAHENHLSGAALQAAFRRPTGDRSGLSLTRDLPKILNRALHEVVQRLFPTLPAAALDKLERAALSVYRQDVASGKRPEGRDRNTATADLFAFLYALPASVTDQGRAKGALKAVLERAGLLAIHTTKGGRIAPTPPRQEQAKKPTRIEGVTLPDSADPRQQKPTAAQPVPAQQRSPNGYKPAPPAGALDQERFPTKPISSLEMPVMTFPKVETYGVLDWLLQVPGLKPWEPGKAVLTKDTKLVGDQKQPRLPALQPGQSIEQWWSRYGDQFKVLWRANDQDKIADPRVAILFGYPEGRVVEGQLQPLTLLDVYKLRTLDVGDSLPGDFDIDSHEIHHAVVGDSTSAESGYFTDIISSPRNFPNSRSLQEQFAELTKEYFKGNIKDYPNTPEIQFIIEILYHDRQPGTNNVFKRGLVNNPVNASILESALRKFLSTPDYRNFSSQINAITYNVKQAAPLHDGNNIYENTIVSAIFRVEFTTLKNEQFFYDNIESLLNERLIHNIPPLDAQKRDSISKLAAQAFKILESQSFKEFYQVYTSIETSHRPPRSAELFLHDAAIAIALNRTTGLMQKAEFYESASFFSDPIRGWNDYLSRTPVSPEAVYNEILKMQKNGDIPTKQQIEAWHRQNIQQTPRP